ncbi:MAG: hypothetical protein R8P61_32310 [Bacteroidia bacterium]|nr:hypothetical protein [Bacteroidia bacterium]
MGRLTRNTEKPYLLKKRIDSISNEETRKAVHNSLNAILDTNRKHDILRDRTDDLTLTEALLISDILGCTPAQLADNSFDFNVIEHEKSH